ncbi:hypothetical protein AOT31_03235 [Corynebacterium ulcerans]|uniref:MtrAB system accessory lipoprotein LpqB n=1 Tax=Corynebacterium ulcerans TaxID=65058 RepID=UPI0006C7FC69|nr:MtrAB system accessory lipoprotein LpqB [Corynebacterium ulcerans]KPJ24822.1 hypothetical protein AOT31_03235 [Corynebacterium ulcerans]BDV25418.1 lipoprotein LpqB [Corynebacterium ulcerans]
MARVVRLGLSVGLVGALVSACTTLPSSSDPQALRGFDVSTSTEQQAPVAGQEPDLLLRDFYEASTNPSQRYKHARGYLTGAASERWSPSTSVLVLDGIDINSSANSSASRRVFDVRGTIVGSLEEGGSYVSKNESYSTTITLERVNSEWRIAELPDQIVVQRNELWNHYDPKQLYFFDTSGSTLVSDRRWVFKDSSASRNSVESALLTLMIGGPSRNLTPGVVNEVPSGASFAGLSNGFYQFTGMSGLGQDEIRRLSAQFVWTLALSGSAGPFKFAFDGVPLKSERRDSEELTVDDFAEYNPQAGASVSTETYALTNGSLRSVVGGQAAPVAGSYGTVHDIESVAISSKDKVTAAIRAVGSGDTKKSSLLLGTVGGNYSEVLSAKTMTKPTFEPGASSLWTVQDGRKIIRLARSSSGGDIVETEVSMDGLEESASGISMLQLSRSGVRAAMIIGGRVYIGIVSRPNAGERKITNIHEVMPAIQDTAVSLDWESNGSLIVGTSSSEAPVWVIAQDGSIATKLSAGNIVAPVVSVASNSSTRYITDARVALELPNSDSATVYWREVQGLEGGRSVIVVPR